MYRCLYYLSVIAPVLHRTGVQAELRHLVGQVLHRELSIRRRELKLQLELVVARQNTGHCVTGLENTKHSLF